jgi:hypothetical protein
MSDETTDTSFLERLKEGLGKVLDNLAKARLERDGVLVAKHKGKTITVRAKDLK